MLRLGPITIMSSRTHDAYRDLANAAYDLHQHIWYTDDLCSAEAEMAVRQLDAILAATLSHTPPEDIE